MSAIATLLVAFSTLAAFNSERTPANVETPFEGIYADPAPPQDPTIYEPIGAPAPGLAVPDSVGSKVQSLPAPPVKLPCPSVTEGFGCEPLCTPGGAGGCACGDRDGGCGGCCNDCCGCGTSTFAGAELTLLRLQIGSLSISAIDGIFDEPVRLTPEYDIQPALRLWVGREACNGLGWRITGWHFEDDARLGFDAETGAGLHTDLDFYSVHFDLTQRGCFAGWNLLGAMGISIGGVQEGIRFDSESFPLSLDHNFDGAGLTFATEFHRSLGWGGWEMYGILRASFLFGRTKFRLASGPTDTEQVDLSEFDVNGRVTDQIVSVWEMRVGAEKKWCTDYGMAFFRAGLEAQMWELPPILFGLGDQNIGLFGPTLAFGLTR